MFIRLGIEMKALARATLVGGQEYADFKSNLGIAPYFNQIKAINLLSRDEDLTGFEGGFAGKVIVWYP